MRYVKMGHHEPGVRRDVLKGEDIFSTRFLSAEEHNSTGWFENAWAATFCLVVRAPALVDFYARPWVTAYFVVCGIALNVLAIALLVLVR